MPITIFLESAEDLHLRKKKKNKERYLCTLYICSQNCKVKSNIYALLKVLAALKRQQKVNKLKKQLVNAEHIKSEERRPSGVQNKKGINCI